MTTAGILLTTLTYILILIAILTFPLVKKITNSYLFWFFYSATMLALVLVFRFYLDFKDASNAFKIGISQSDGLILSKSFLLDFCPATCLLISFLPIVDPTRKSAQVIAPIAVFGGLITLTFEILMDSNAAFTFEYIFQGVGSNRAYFLIHFINAMTGTLVLLNTPKTNFKTFIWTNVFAICYYLYVFIIVKIFDGIIIDHTSGLLPDDWNGGEYWRVAELLKVSYPWCMIISLTLAYFVIVGILFSPKLLQKNKHWIVPNVKSYTPLWGYYNIEIVKLDSIQ